MGSVTLGLTLALALAVGPVSHATTEAPDARIAIAARVAAAADPTTESTTEPSSDVDPGADPDAPETVTTWAVRPATEAGPDQRSWIEAEVEPGEKLTEYLAVSNFGKEPVTFSLVAADGLFTQTGRFTILPDDQPSTGAGTWIDLSDSVEVVAGATVVVPFTVTVPENATPGDHAAGVAAGIMTKSGANSSGVSVNSRVGFRVMLSVAGEEKPALALSDVELQYEQSWNPFEPGDVSVSAGVENAGNTWLKTALQAQASGSAIELGAKELLPGDAFAVSSKVKEVWPLGFVTVEVTATGAGREDGAQPTVVSEEYTVWAIPIPQLAVLLGLGLMVGGLVLARGRNKRKWESRLQEARAAGRSEANASAADVSDEADAAGGKEA